MKILTYDVKKSKLVKAGEFTNGVFIKEVKAKHYFRMIDGYAVQEDVIQRLKELGCEKIYIETPTALWESEFERWLQSDVRISDFGHGKQRLMPLRFMKNITKRRKK